MKRIASALWNEPVLAGAVLNVVVATLAAEGVVSGWVPAVLIAISGIIVRRFTIPEKKLVRELDKVDHYEGSN